MDSQMIKELEQLMREVSTWVKRRERAVLEHFPITPPQFSAMILLDEQGDMTIGDLSQKCCLACSTMTDLVDRMEKNQVVERVRDARDRRVIRIHLLPSGREMIAEVMKRRQQDLSELLANITADEAIAMKQQLTKILQNIKTSSIGDR